MGVEKSKRRARRGLTLVEVMVSITLLAMIMGGAYSLVTRSQALSRVARNHYVAANLAKNRLERARNFQYGDLALLAESRVRVNENGTPAANGFFRRTTTVQTNYAVGLTRVLVTVDIPNQRSGQFVGEQEVIDTLFTEYLTQ